MKNKEDFLSSNSIFDSSSEENKLLFTKYYFTCSDNLCFQLLKNKSSIYDWIKPGIEDICFLKDDKIWLYSIAHEEYCLIYCENEKEYEFLKSIGIEFEGDCFYEQKEEPLF